MLIYNSDNPYQLKSAMVEFVSSMAFIAVFWQLVLYYKSHSPSIELIIMTGGACIRLFKNLYNKKVHQIIINSSAKSITASFKSLISAIEEQKVVSFDNCKLVIDKNQGWFLKKGRTIIRFFDGKAFSFEASKSSGGFSVYTIDDMVDNLEKLTRGI